MTNNLEAFNPSQLSFARKRRGFTKAALASLLDITPKTLANYENGRFDPKYETVERIATFLNFPESFFFCDDISEIPLEAVSFRSLARMTASVRDAAICSGQIALEFSNWMDKRFELPKADLPDLRNFEPEAAAEVIRNEWAIGQRPIGNMVHLLEAKGVRVFSLTEETDDMDAFSFWMKDHPYVFLNTRKSVERSRFDAAHELGHILLHKHSDMVGKEAEGQANKFAAALLMPPGSVVAKAPYRISLKSLISLKAYWKVSASALAVRLKDLSLLSEWRYRSLMIELSSRGLMKSEPNPLTQRETSKILPMVFKELRKEGVRKEDIAKGLSVYVDDIDALIFNLTMVGINGGSGPKNVIQPNGGGKKKAKHLRRVK